MKNFRIFFGCSLGLVLACGEEPTAPRTVDDAADQITPALSVAAGALSFLQVSAGSNHTCGITTLNQAYCWGVNFTGELGNGSSSAGATARPSPVIGGFRFLEARAGNDFSCGLTTENRAYCWGSNDQGQLGTGSPAQYSLGPVAVAGGRRFTAVNATGWHACALNADHVAFCWGDNRFGQLGDGTTTNRRAPVRVAGGLHFLQIRAGVVHTCGLSTDHRAYCWGQNSAAQLGDGTVETRLKPVLVLGGHTFGQLSAGTNNTCGVTLDSHGYCWGTNLEGEIGDGSTVRKRLRPSAIAGGLLFRGVDPGGGHTCGVTLDRKTYCWGLEFSGQLGDGVPGGWNVRRSPVLVVGGLTFSAVNTGTYHNCGVTTSSRAYCWGQNESGQLGNGTTADQSVPTAVVGPS
jgi:alpha-tubulin suppressor-like RCC1 family protein